MTGTVATMVIRRWWVLPLLAGFVTALGGCQLVDPAPPPPLLLQRVVVLDGDTFDATTTTGVRVRVRLLGVDAPELAHAGRTAQCGAEAARRQLRRLVQGSTVELVDDPGSDRVDRYDRRLGYVADGYGADVGLAVIKAGVAEAWAPASAAVPSRMSVYLEAQQAAQRAGVGSWQACGGLGRSVSREPRRRRGVQLESGNLAVSHPASGRRTHEQGVSKSNSIPRHPKPLPSRGEKWRSSGGRSALETCFTANCLRSAASSSF